ncbi:Putative universal stress protein [Acaryochloris thomasi RCC1774]|uniref:Universal stress protein n=1 Tax=Acaryochloris thomasi RCC1774 TaxID=1764569 RepID=A0A2W1JIP8_9CYAN|nr:universal stress protein [Acaryochloris thomasi]PZD70932.1 Putative universal stress protein [Acaryochloris thomasi RCC1774]
MYKSILVAMDVFDSRTTVFEEALKLARLSGAKLVLLHALSNDEVGYPNVPPLGIDEAYYERWRSFVKEGLLHLNRFKEQAETEDVEAEMLQEIGRPGHVICAVAQEQNVDLIIIGNRGRSGLSEAVLGSQSNYVMHHAPCSVLVHRLTEDRSQSSDDKAPLAESV